MDNVVCKGMTSDFDLGCNNLDLVSYKYNKTIPKKDKSGYEE